MMNLNPSGPNERQNLSEKEKEFLFFIRIQNEKQNRQCNHHHRKSRLDNWKENITNYSLFFSFYSCISLDTNLES